MFTWGRCRRSNRTAAWELAESIDCVKHSLEPASRVQWRLTANRDVANPVLLHDETYRAKIEWGLTAQMIPGNAASPFILLTNNARYDFPKALPMGREFVEHHISNNMDLYRFEMDPGPIIRAIPPTISFPVQMDIPQPVGFPLPPLPQRTGATTRASDR